VGGNHDFWLGDYLTREIGLEVHFKPIEWTLYGKRFYLNHGDGIAKADWGYRILRRILRNKVNIFLFRLIHPDIGVPLAKWVSGSSRSYTNARKLIIEKFKEDYISFARDKIEEALTMWSWRILI